jgi:hypothetical protein
VRTEGLQDACSNECVTGSISEMIRRSPRKRNNRAVVLQVP